MKAVLSGLILALALTQAAEARTKIPVTETKTNCQKNRPLLDQKATGGIVPLPGQSAKAAEPGQAYPPALDLHF
ncbi:hypothetical protein [Mesorhizobium sp. ORS 3428]|uniref:hypothetical protein n=1 Tax=Mesorhizobium sp. ORS 3428 TaxID=540997 RepID=UPI0008DA9BCC|nr:hypothetical protein [Mesorhizobium sp. ORS 3428]OHV86484.1 hypothetical protein ORS3428_23740 [Mesorhizobium sp. ORS 3428]